MTVVTMTELQILEPHDAAMLRAFDLMTDSATRHVTDRARAVIALKAAYALDHNTRGWWYYRVTQMILEKRANWLTWLTLNQRKWQSKGYGKRNDRDIEKYIRCSSD